MPRCGRDDLQLRASQGWMEHRDAGASQAERPRADFSIQLQKGSKTPLPGNRKWGLMPFRVPPAAVPAPPEQAVLCFSAGGSEENTSSTNSADPGESMPAKGGGGFGRGSALTSPLSTSRA